MKKVFFLSLLILLSSDAFAVGEFITRWNLAIAGSSPTQLSFATLNAGTVNYSWKEVSPGSATGSGTFGSGIITISGLPSGAIIDLSISPTNFRRILIDDDTDKDRLTDVKQWGTTPWSSMAYAFRGCSNLQISATDLPDLGATTNTVGMFLDCAVLNGPANIGSWNTGNLTSMENMFNGAIAFNQPIGSWNTAKVTSMFGMFYSASAFNQPIGNWNTGNVTVMSAMFAYARAFNQPIGNWNTAKVTDLRFIFLFANGFNQPLNNWNTANVTDMASAFYGAFAFNQPVGNWNTAKVTLMSGMFESATAFNQSLGSWTFNASVVMTTMLNRSGMDCTNYSATLLGWSNNATTPAGRTLGAVGRNYGTSAVAARNILTGTKGWTITGDAASGSDCKPLPVRLISFTGKVQGGTVSLDWQTADEQNNKGFEIEKSADAKTFEKIGFVDGSGDSKRARKYQFSDFNPLPVNYYRLKQIDFDGTSEYSRIISLKGGEVSFSIYPNPAQNHLYLKNLEGNAEVAISTMDGKVLMKRIVNASEPIDVKSIPSGLFILQIGNENKKLVILR